MPDDLNDAWHFKLCTLWNSFPVVCFLICPDMFQVFSDLECLISFVVILYKLYALLLTSIFFFSTAFWFPCPYQKALWLKESSMRNNTLVFDISLLITIILHFQHFFLQVILRTWYCTELIFLFFSCFGKHVF